MLPDVEAAVTAMVRRWQRELCEVQQKYGFELVEDTMRWLEGQVDAAGGGPCAVADGRGLVGCSREQDEVLGGGATGEVAIRLSTILARRKLSSVVARWCALVARGRATMAGSAQQRRIEQMSSRECRRWRKACMRRLARAWWAGTRRETVTVLVRRWECVVRERNKRRVAALAAMAVSAQTAIVRRVWLELVGRFWVDSRGGGGGGCEMEVEVERQKSGEGDGDSVVYDWSCTQCGWGGRLVEAGHFTCSKCEWQCLSWCEAAARIEMADDEMVGRMVQQRPMGRRVAAGVRRRMGEELRRLQGDLVEQQSCGWRQRVQQTRRIGSGAAAGGRDGGFRPPKPRPKAVETGCESSQFLTIGSDPVDKTGRLPELAADGIEVEVVAADAEEVRLALVEVRAAVLADMVVDSAGKASWWLTWLEAATDVEAVEAAVLSVCAEEYVPGAVYSRRAAEEYAEVGVLVEEAVSAEACRRAARLAVAEVWREGVDAAADEDSVWAVVLAGRAAIQAARLSLREAREAVELGVAEEAAFLEAAARVRVPAKRKAAVELKAGLVSAEAWVVSAEAQVRADADASAAVMQMQMQVMQSRAEAAAGLRAVAVKQAAELRQEAQVEQAVKEAAMVVAAELEQSVELEFEQFDWHQAVAVGVVATEVHQAAELEVAAEEQAAEVKLAAEVEQAAEVRQAAEEAAVVEVEAEVEYAAEEAAVVEVGAVVEHAAEVEVAAEVEQAAEVEAGVWEAAILQSEAVMAEVMAADAVAAVANGEMVAAVEVAAMVKAEAANAEAATEVAAAAEAVAVDVKAAAEVAVAEAEMKVATDLAATEVAAAQVAAAVDAVAAEAEAATVVAAADAEMQAAAELAAAAEAVAVDAVAAEAEAATVVAAADAEMQAAAELAAAAEAVAVDVEAAAELAAGVTAMIQEAELHGDVMTVAEAVWRHEMLLEEEQQWGCEELCGDAASPQEKQHQQRSRTRNKKKKKKKR